MDPNACCREIKRALLEGDYDQADRGMRDLLRWLKKGGAIPVELGSDREDAIRLLQAFQESLNKWRKA